MEAAKHDLGFPGFELHQVYRVLGVLAKENDWIQSRVYQNSRKVCPRSSKILFYNCTNYFFEIEADFRTVEHEFKARPVSLQREDRILAHFMTCFLALLPDKILEIRTQKALPQGELSGEKILHPLREMDCYKLKGEGSILLYTRNKLTDALREPFGFQTDHETVTLSGMRKTFPRRRSRGASLTSSAAIKCP